MKKNRLIFAGLVFAALLLIGSSGYVPITDMAKQRRERESRAGLSLIRRERRKRRKSRKSGSGMRRSIPRWENIRRL